MTNFTQNIDNLEGHAGILPEKLIQCHGSFATATCIECKYKVKCEEIYNELKAGKVARCDRCIQSIRQAKPGLKRKRSSNGSSVSRKKRQSYEDSTDDEDDDIAVAGIMKPDITFFGEDLPATFHDRLMGHDRDLVDLVLVIGTSLKVAPVSEVVGVLPHHVPQLYISREVGIHQLIPYQLYSPTSSHVLTPTSTLISLATAMSWSQSSVGVLDGIYNMT